MLDLDFLPGPHGLHAQRPPPLSGGFHEHSQHEPGPAPEGAGPGEGKERPRKQAGMMFDDGRPVWPSATSEEHI
ncbi:hypothetical protein ACFW9X_43680, partial [Streptomyces sp. NPDC059466]